MSVHRIFKKGLAVFYIERGGDFGDEGIESWSKKFDVARLHRRPPCVRHCKQVNLPNDIIEYRKYQNIDNDDYSFSSRCDKDRY